MTRQVRWRFALGRGRRSLHRFVRIRVHPLFLGLLAIAVFVGLWREVLILFLLVMLHEMGHALAAEALGYEVESIALLPFGGVARLTYGNIGFRPKHEAIIAAAGPFVNLVLALLVWLPYVAGWCSVAFLHQVIGLNAWIVLFNLLPGLPLDGGRVLRAAKAKTKGFEQATREAYNMAIGIALLLLVIGGISLWMGAPHLGMVVLGSFLFVSAWSGRRDISMEVVRFLDVKRQAGHVQPVPVKALVTPSSATVRDVVRQFAPDRFHMVYVLDDVGTVTTVLEEGELLDAAFAGQWLQTIQEWINGN